MFKGINALNFQKTFSTDDKCRAYLFDLKWSMGYNCNRCKCTQFWKGRTEFHVRCSKCGYDESVTANTIFHKIKIPLIKAFAMAFRIVVSKKGISTLGLSREFCVSQESAWLFKRKVQESLKPEERCHKATEKNFLEDLLSAISINRRGILIEKKDAEQEKKDYVKNLFSLSLKSNLKDGTLQEGYKNSAEYNINKGRNLIVHNFKIWINGIHHHCSLRFFLGYADEFFFRLRNRQKMPLLWHTLMVSLVKGKPYFYKPNVV